MQFFIRELWQVSIYDFERFYKKNSPNWESIEKLVHLLIKFVMNHFHEKIHKKRNLLIKNRMKFTPARGLKTCSNIWSIFSPFAIEFETIRLEDNLQINATPLFARQSNPSPKAYPFSFLLVLETKTLMNSPGCELRNEHYHLKCSSSTSLAQYMSRIISAEEL